MTTFSGCSGQQTVTGKSVGTDLAAHKATSVVVAAHQLADAGLRRQLSELMSTPALGPAEVERWRALIIASGAVQWIEQLIDERLTQALGCLDTAGIPEMPRAALEDMAVVCTKQGRLMRTVEGRTDRVVIVGAGLSGLSAALQLAGRGRTVTVVERGDHPGGRVGRADISGYRLDTGPTVLTMPDIIDDAFAAVGETLSDRLELQSVHPAYQAMFADGSTLKVHTEPTAMFAEIERFAGPREADAYLQLRAWLTKLYRTEFDGFIGANFDSPLSLLTPQLARLAAMGGFRRWENVVRRFLNDERLLRVFTFQALYAGVPPQSALAVYAVIAYMDTIAGVYFPRGGMRALPDAMAAAAAAAGVEFIYGSTVSELEWSGSRVTAVRTAAGHRVPADAVVLTTELPDTYRLLGRTPRRLLRLRPAPSAVVAHVGCRRVDDRVGHHTILFGDAWRQTFRDIIDDGQRHG